MPLHAWSTFDRPTVRRAGLGLAAEALRVNGFEVAQPDVRRNVLRARRGEQALEVHVRTLRGLGAATWPAEALESAPGRHACLVRLPEGRPPEIYLIPATAWDEPVPPIVARDAAGGGAVRLGAEQVPALWRYRVERVLAAVTLAA